MKVKYITDKKYDEQVVIQMQRLDKKRAADLVVQQYKKNKNLISKKIKDYQKSWDKINDVFFREIENITGKKWKYKIYEVVLSPINKGISSLGGNKVIRSAFEDPEEQKRITAHEILMSHLWNIFFELYPESRKDENHSFWALNEITTTAILGLEPKINFLWTKSTKGFDQYLKNYPQLKILKEKLKKEYLNKISFEDYIKKALDLIKNKSIVN